MLDFGGVYDGYCVDLTRTVEVGAAGADGAGWLQRCRRGAPGGDCDSPPGHPAQRGRCRGTRRAGPARAGRGVWPRHRARPRARGSRGTADRAGRRRGQPDVLLEPGMVFTIEPGAYVEGLGGARLEDDVLVTATGCGRAHARLRRRRRGIRRLIGIRRHRTDSGAGEAARSGGVRARAGRTEAPHPQSRARAGNGRILPAPPAAPSHHAATTRRRPLPPGPLPQAADGEADARTGGRQVADRRHVLPLAGARRGVVRRDRPAGQEGSGPLHHRSDEADERDHVGVRR